MTERWYEQARSLLTGKETVEIINARVPACLIGTALDDELIKVNLMIEGGRIAAITPAHSSSFGGPKLDMDEGMVWPCPVDIHTHLDKGHIWPRKHNPDGTFKGALNSVADDRAENWSADDVAKRMEFSLHCAYHHGTAAIRTHLDSIGSQMAISWPVFEEIREAWAGRIELQAVSLFGIDALENEDFLPRLLRYVRHSDGVLGAVAYKVPGLEDHLDTLFRAANDHDLLLDFHADETQDPHSDCLLKIAEAALRNDYQRPILVGHCCSLARQDTDTINRTLDCVAQTGIGVVTLPLCNLYLQDRTYEGANPLTPRWRGVTLLHEMKARGIPVMVASDNTRDPFYAYGDMDLFEVYREATRILHLDHPVDDWPRTITATPAGFAPFSHKGFFEDQVEADFILMRARSYSELLSRPQTDRVVVRKGKAISTECPDYRELDELVGVPSTARKAMG